ncbi:ammonium transporter [Caulobacter sp. 17J65-9]|nr:ammonium transporter [Caulobacter sp. 17J65-9]
MAGGRVFGAGLALGVWGLAQSAQAAVPIQVLRHQVPLELDQAASSWVLTSTALVLLMTLPGLALFYGGMVRRKNVLATVAQSAASAVVVTLLWFMAGYSLAFGKAASPGLDAVIGGFQALFLDGVRVDTAHSLAKGLPEFLWIAYQMTFAIITPALIAGAFAERMKFSAFLLFVTLWHLIVYAPVCHWVWGGGFLGSAGVLDFAGGAVVHVNSGVAGLVCALVLGPRRGFGRDNLAPHNLVLTMIGASLLWVGWIGFNAGSAWAADGVAAAALISTLIAAAAGGVGWTALEWVERKKPTMLGLVSGAVAGLVAITPAAGFTDPKGGFFIGLIGGAACYAGAVWLKRKLKYDDSLDAFGVHGIGGLVGAVLTGLFANAAINPVAEGASVLKQAWGLLAVIAWSGVATYGILWICKLTTGLRVAKDEEIEGLDLTQHGEALHDA